MSGDVKLGPYSGAVQQTLRCYSGPVDIKRRFPVAQFAIELTQAETQLAKLIKEVSSGTEIVITSNGQSVARLVPPGEAAPDRVPGSAKGLFVVPDDFDAPVEDFRDYM